MSSALWWTEGGLAPLAEASTPLMAPADALRQPKARGRLDLVVSGLLQHQLVCPDALPLRDAAAVAAYAEQQFIHYFGSDAEHWPLAAWQAGPLRGACALHGGARAAWAELQSTALMPRIGRVLPAWAVALSGACAQHPQWAAAPEAALAWVEGPLLCWVELRDGLLVGLRQLRTCDLGSHSLWELVVRLLKPQQSALVLGYGRDATGDGETPPEGVLLPGPLNARRPSPDALRQCTPGAGLKQLPDFQSLRTRPPTWWHWPLVGCSALALATAAMDSHAAWSVLQSERERQSLSAKVATPRAGAAAVRATRQTREPIRQASAMTATQAALNHPWELVLAQVEQAGHRPAEPGASVSWLALEHRAGKAELRLEGQTADKRVAMQLAQDWAGQPAWSEVLLTRFQTAPDGGQRFELSAKADLPLLMRVQAERVAAQERRP